MDRGLDRIGALAGAFTSVFLLFARRPDLTISYVVYLASCIIALVTFLIRRPALEVDGRPWVLLLSFLRLIWLFVPFWIPAHLAHPLIPMHLGDAISICLMIFIIYARLSLGRNVGIIPAKRQLVTHGAYRIVRHPIQSGQMLLFWNFVLLQFSLPNLAVALGGTIIFAWKSRIEEAFLSRDAEYRAYLARVRWRFVPYVW